MASRNRNTEAPQSLFHFMDELKCVTREGSEIVVIKLLGLGRMGSLQGSASGNDIRATESKAFFDDEEFLFNSRVA